MTASKCYTKVRHPRHINGHILTYTHSRSTYTDSYVPFFYFFCGVRLRVLVYCVINTDVLLLIILLMYILVHLLVTNTWESNFKICEKQFYNKIHPAILKYQVIFSQMVFCPVLPYTIGSTWLERLRAIGYFYGRSWVRKVSVQIWPLDKDRLENHGSHT